MFGFDEKFVYKILQFYLRKKAGDEIKVPGLADGQEADPGTPVK